MTTDALTLAQWLSPAFPISAFAYSHGLEQAVAMGDVTDGRTLTVWLEDVLHHGSIPVDVAVMAASHRGDRDVAQEQVIAMAASAERVFETLTQGAAFARTLRDAFALEVADAAYPVVLGQAASARSIDLKLTATLYVQSVLTNLIQAAQRLAPIGQTDGQRILITLMGQVDPVVDRALDTALDDLSSSAFLSDIRAMQHETLQPRIFRT